MGGLAVIVVLLGAYWASRAHLPDPATADRDGLLRWLILRDLRNEPLKTRNILISRFQKELRSGLDMVSLRQEMEPRYEDRLWANILTLIETWFNQRVNVYSTMSDSERPRYLDKTISEVRKWKNLAALQPGWQKGKEDLSSEVVLLEILTQQIAVWKKQASPRRRKEITEFDAALRRRWVLQTLGLTSAAPSNERARNKDIALVREHHGETQGCQETTGVFLNHYLK